MTSTTCRLSFCALTLLVFGACSGPAATTGVGSDEPLEATPVATEAVDTADNDGQKSAQDSASAGDATGEPSRDDIRIAAIERAVNETEAAQHECWAFAAADDFRVRGTMVLRLTFGAEHKASAVDVLMDEPGDAQLRACIVELFQRYTWPSVFEAGQAIELPLEFKAPRGQYTVAAKYAESRQVVPGKLQVKVLMHERNTGNGAGGVSLMRVTGDIDTGLHWHNTSTEILYVLEGQISMYTKPGGKGKVTAKAGQALYVPPGLAHAGLHKGQKSALILQFFTPEGPQRRYVDGRGLDIVQASEGSPLPRSKKKIVLAKRPTVHPIAGGRGQVAFFFEEAVTGETAAYMGVLTAQPGVAVPPHKHPGESEYLYLLKGGGTMTVAGDRYPVGPETAVQIPANTEHAVVVESDEPLVAVQFYTPAGPEQRFKQPPAKN